MFWFRKITPVLIAIQPLLLCSCDSKKSAPPVTFNIDTSKIHSWEKEYNSLYEKYDNSKEKEIKFLQEGGFFADSILAFEQQLLKDTSQQTLFFSILFNRGADLTYMKDDIKSLDIWEKYITLYSQYKIDETEKLAYVQLTLGNIYTRYGDYKKAMLLLRQSLEYYKNQKINEYITVATLNLSIPLKELRRFNEAEKILLDIFTLPAVSDNRKARICIELADIYTRQQKIAEAGSEIQKAKKFIALVPYSPERTDIYTLLSNIEGNWLLAGNKPQESLNAYQRSLDSASISSGGNLRNREIGKTYIAMGNALEQLNYFDSALHLYNKALYTVVNIDTLNRLSLPQQKELYAENTIAEALYARAHCIIARGMENTRELENAVHCYKLAFETERKLLDAFSYDESRQQMLEQTRKQVEKAIAVCYHLYQRTRNGKWANDAFLFAEHNKSFILTESVRRNTAASIYLQNDPSYEKLLSLRTESSMIETELGKQNASGTPDTILTRSLSAAREKNEVALLEAENNLRLKNPAYSNWLAGNTALTAEELISKTTSSGNSFIEYFTGDSSIYAFSSEKNKPLGFYQLPGNIKNSTDSFLHYFSNRNLILNDPAGYAAAANDLYRSLLAPYVATGRSSLLIIPDGFISLIPFDALLTGPVASANISSFPFLIRQQETHYAFSCRTLVEQANDKNKGKGNTVAAFAPVFAGMERGLAPLVNSAAELEALKQFYPQGKFFPAGSATLKQFEQTCNNAEIIHLATHAGQGNSMATPGIEFFDSTLYLNRIYSMPLKAKLVVLSGCETGTGSINKTEGLMSLARGFSYAGTKNVIGSLWPTDDRVSAEIFRHFYGNLSSDHFSTALYKAKLSVINNSSAASASPYFWSGYIYIGSPGDNIKDSSFGWLKYTLLVTGLLLIAGLFAFRKKNKI